MQPSSISPQRLRAFSSIIMILMLLAVARSVQVQVFEAPRYASAATRQQVETLRIAAPRGTIFDRTGLPLAVSRQGYLLRVNARVLTDVVTVAEAIAPALGKPSERVQQHLQAVLNDQGNLTPTLSSVIAHNLTPDAARQIERALAQANREGLILEPYWMRAYPQGLIAGPTLGFVNLEPAGYIGVEGYYDKELNALEGVRQGRARLDLLTISPTIRGADIVLTLDADLQLFVESRLQQALQESGARSGTILVMEAPSGAILAAASAPGFDPNRALEIASQGALEQLIDPAVSLPYEPGSVLKVMTWAIALDSGKANLTSTFTDTGRLEIRGQRIFNSDRKAHGVVTIEDILALSLNVPTAQMAMDTGAQTFYAYLQNFGFGSITGVDLGSESPGVLRTPRDVMWSPTDLATNSFGQGLSATPYQVLSAFNAIANDGLLMQPYVVREWRKPNGEFIARRPVQARRVISAETARAMRSLMASATKRATPEALLPGYSVAGKTGTANWYLRGVKQKTTIVTYVGMLPAESPRLTILVKLDEPTSSPWAAATTVPVFRDIAAHAVRLLGIPPAEEGGSR